MSIQFEEDRPLSSYGLPPEKPKAMIKFLIEEGVAPNPKVAKIELIVIAVILFLCSIGLFIYRGVLLSREENAITYDPTHDPMINVTRPYDENY